MLAIPHVAFAIGFAFLFGPSGLGMRTLHSIVGETSTNGELALLVKDPYALGLDCDVSVKRDPVFAVNEYLDSAAVRHSQNHQSERVTRLQSFTDLVEVCVPTMVQQITLSYVGSTRLQLIRRGYSAYHRPN